MNLIIQWLLLFNEAYGLFYTDSNLKLLDNTVIGGDDEDEKEFSQKEGQTQDYVSAAPGHGEDNSVLLRLVT